MTRFQKFVLAVAAVELVGGIVATALGCQAGPVWIANAFVTALWL